MEGKQIQSSAEVPRDVVAMPHPGHDTTDETVQGDKLMAMKKATRKKAGRKGGRKGARKGKKGRRKKA